MQTPYRASTAIFLIHCGTLTLKKILEKRNTENVLNEIHIKLKKKVYISYIFEYLKLENKNDKSEIRTLVNLIRLHSCCFNSLTVTAKAYVG